MNPNESNIVTPSTSPAAPAPNASTPSPIPPVPLATGAVISTPAPAASTSKTKKADGSPNSNSTQNTLQISEIRDGLVILNDGSFRAVIMCKSINFDLMSGPERDAVEFSYQGFLNSLYFPIQIFIRSKRVDLTPYLNKLDHIRANQESMLLALLMEDYIAFLAEIAGQTNIMDKSFYVIIGYPDRNADVRRAIKTSTGFFTGLADLFGGSKTPHVVVDQNTLENAKTELKNRVQAAMQGLQQCGVQSVPLDTQELIELFYEAYNPDTATRQQLTNAGDLTAEVIGKGQGTAPTPGLDRGVV